MEMTPTATPTMEMTPTPTMEMTPTPTMEMTPTPTMGMTPTPTMEMTPTPTMEMTPTPTADDYVAPDALMVTTNPGGLNDDAALRLSPDLNQVIATFDELGDIASLESLQLDGAGNGYLTYDRQGGDGGILVIDGLEGFVGEDEADDQETVSARTISGVNTGLVAPKGLVVTADYIIVADVGAGDIKVFDINAEDNEAPLFIVDELGGASSVWDVAFDDGTLYAAGTNGNVLIYNDFIEDAGDNLPSTTLIPTDDGGNRISVNLHGIQYVPAGGGLPGLPLDDDALFVSDVGDPASATDGQIFVFRDIEEAENETAVSLRIVGSDTELGNPVDLFFDGDDLFIAEKSNSMILRYDGLLDLSGEINDRSDESTMAVNAESVFVSDGVYAVENPAGRLDDRIQRFEAALEDPIGTRGVTADFRNIQSVKIGAGNSGYFTYDATDGRGGIMIVDDFAGSTGDMALMTGDRLIVGANTNIVAPKGLELTTTHILIADVGAQDIKGFLLNASGDIAPDVTISDLGAEGRAVWDVEYDDVGDRLYGAGTDGVVVVYDDFSSTRGVGGPDRTIIPENDDSETISINLHGLDYVGGAMDSLILSDVGDAGVANDGQLFVINNASTASGSMAVSYRVRGGQTQLGNPVDLDYDGKHLYVAEKANGAILRFDDFMDGTGDTDLRPDASISLSAAESVDLIFTDPTDD